MLRSPSAKLRSISRRVGSARAWKTASRCSTLYSTIWFNIEPQRPQLVNRVAYHNIYERFGLSASTGNIRVSYHFAKDPGRDSTRTAALRRRKRPPPTRPAQCAAYHRYALDDPGKDQGQSQHGRTASDREFADRTALPLCSVDGASQERTCIAGTAAC